MSIEQDLRQIQRNMKTMTTKVNKAAAKSINTLAKKAKQEATKTVAKDLGVNVKTLRGRTRQRKGERATASRLTAQMRVNLKPMPLIRVLESKRNRVWVGQGGIMVGKFAVKRGFVQTLKNGRTHIMQRAGRARYSIDVVKIPLRDKLKNAYRKALATYPEDVKRELESRLSSVFKV
ncbi:phage tail protein [Pasteurellaceae bacterium 20609_3]|uniref:phage tail protein n=1 Tax=Spirabiliibacterium mucosae TaxID=28156 RepID=UPI001AAD28E9|nr:phage tail protein [Spirabiliibacterium mucosae]MBE2898087.1 phage tail protein [Spirabiliibacterium mucosae]